MTTSAEPDAYLLRHYPAFGAAIKPYLDRQTAFEAPTTSFIWIRRLLELLPASQNVQETMTDWNEVAALLDKEGQVSLSHRFARTLPRKSVEWNARYNDAFLDVVSEMLGYGWLKRQGASQVRFVPDENKDTSEKVPDLVADLGIAVECKHIRSSDYDRDYLANHQLEARAVTGYAPAGLKWKIEQTISAALPKFESFPSPSCDRFIFIDIDPDIEFRLCQWSDSNTERELSEELNAFAVSKLVQLVIVKEHSLGAQIWPIQS